MSARNVQGPVFVVIRFPMARVQACKNSLIKHLSVHRNYSGAIAGLSRSIQVIEGKWPRDRGVAILSFQSLREAELWKDSVPEIRQQDWLDGVDLIIVPVNELPPENKRFVQILDINFRDFGQFMSEYAYEASNYLQESGACGGVISTDKFHIIKGLWDPGFLIFNFWSGPEEFEAAYTSERYQPMKEKRFVCADTNSCVFELENILPNRRY